jgi:hypothetical protein
MYTYVFAFYLGKTNVSAIFEDNQRDLESATEKLSEYLERDITSENLADIKQKVHVKQSILVYLLRRTLTFGFFCGTPGSRQISLL